MAMLSAFLIFFAVSASAQTQTVPPAGLSVSPDGRMVMSSQICDLLPGKTAGVPGADYTPGVDVNGDAVAPADLPSSGPSVSTDNFPIEISRDLAGKFGIPAGTGAKAVIGYVTVRNNQAFFNGQPLNPNQRAVMAEACRSARD